MTHDVATLIDEGRVALALCDWSRAQASFEAALEREQTPDGLDGLGQALYWQGQYPRALEHRERAYALYRQRGELRRAAFVAVQLAQLHGLLYGNGAAVSGWLGHARRLLDECDECPEHGWVALFEAAIASAPADRARHATTALDVGRRFDDPALEFDALGYLGKAQVETGAVQEGVQLVDEAVAAVSGGVVTDPWAAGEIYCTLFHVCELTVDVRRAESWLDAVDGYVGRTGELPISGICRMHYGGVLTAAGRWPTRSTSSRRRWRSTGAPTEVPRSNLSYGWPTCGSVRAGSKKPNDCSEDTRNAPRPCSPASGSSWRTANPRSRGRSSPAVSLPAGPWRWCRSWRSPWTSRWHAAPMTRRPNEPRPWTRQRSDPDSRRSAGWRRGRRGARGRARGPRDRIRPLRRGTGRAR